MNYSFLNIEGNSLAEKVLRYNRHEKGDFDISFFPMDKTLPAVINFRDRLLELRNKKVLIVGDYDCDGICATTIIKRLLDRLEIANNYYIPSRVKEGYGINENILNIAINHSFDVILTVDNGAAASEVMEKAYSAGIMTLIIDHHEYHEIPKCEAFLHPNVLDEYHRDLCAAGLCQLLSTYFYEDELSLVYGGIATLADMVSVFGYNRYLLKKSLEILNGRDIYAIHCLSKKTKYEYETLSFDVIPKINSISRMGDLGNVNMLVKYLLAPKKLCIPTAEDICRINDARKRETKKMSERAFSMIESESGIIVLKSADFQEGLCGLIANRVMNECHRSVIVFAEKDGMLKGSGRGYGNINLYESLLPIKAMFDSFGGHEKAVGLSLMLDKFDEFSSYVSEIETSDEEPRKEVILLDEDDLNYAGFLDYEQLKPFDTSFKEPLFGISKDLIKRKYKVKDKYPKFRISGDCEAISFNEAHAEADFDIMIGRLKRNEYTHNGITFMIEDLF